MTLHVRGAQIPLAVAVAGSMLVSGCRGGPKGPEEIVKEFVAAQKAKDLDRIVRCFTPDVRELLQTRIQILGRDMFREQVAGAVEKKTELKIVDTKIDGDRAEVTYFLIVEGKGPKDKLHLRKVEGAWLIDIPESEKEKFKAANTLQFVRRMAEDRIRFLEEAVELFHFDTDGYPSEEQGLEALLQKPLDSEGWQGPYYTGKLPKDPWGNDYIYRQPGSDGAGFDIICYGKDGIEGGEGENKDIANHDDEEQ